VTREFDAGRHEQAVNDLRELPREVEAHLVTAFSAGVFQERWNAIVAKAESEGVDGQAALAIAARELWIDFIEVLRATLLAREKATFERMQK
jgi:phenylacetate-coenzyme A ligase PaaK-like adenylate-forming protein